MFIHLITPDQINNTTVTCFCDTMITWIYQHFLSFFFLGFAHKQADRQAETERRMDRQTDSIQTDRQTDDETDSLQTHRRTERQDKQRIFPRPTYLICGHVWQAYRLGGAIFGHLAGGGECVESAGRGMGAE